MQAEDAVQVGRVDRTFVPPLKSSTLVSGLGRVRTLDGYIYTRQAKSGMINVMQFWIMFLPMIDWLLW